MVAGTVTTRCTTTQRRTENWTKRPLSVQQWTQIQTLLRIQLPNDALTIRKLRLTDFLVPLLPRPLLLSNSELIFVQERQCAINRHNCMGDVIVLRGDTEVYGVTHIRIMEFALFELGVAKVAAAK
ncbi:hypothetical protein ALQ39_200107 [Pseudomonas amygdali pv. eriobotryae]|uniref:Uncharacterized protein n=2 Tax=Pseudomonas syringae group genomosp. 2 TaxID=251698 RepID=A0A3M3LG14_PSESG|nr:hypothetical protein ALQ66_02437 [Pseudomonas savastanoi pv. glycinea]RMO13392.1 hypothetical protein ALQ46_200167 [Pseudomonas savastanoi pv. phaseolicola]RMO41032.1 hypothetical protein ALQ41_200217 [Pseudomonas savastanoi pv. glycinea]RMO51036.1 hypothetical protein ALQ39_200107 [Pseudomonas amygdali pv. eriobotryae]RMR21309.1 hypothetical protein ALP89_200152 [Pseudomonas syringae pv. persicae]